MLSNLRKKFSAKLLSLVSTDEDKLRSDILRKLVNQESKIGAEILGAPLHSGRREFFLSPTHPNEWLWHEETPDGSKSITVRYIISKEEGVFKSVNGAAYEHVQGKELHDLMHAIKSYNKRVMQEMYPSHIKRAV